MRRLLLLSMVCDGSDLVLQFLRSFDTEQSDPTEVSRRIADLIHKLDVMFVRGRCAEAGFTAKMLSHLSRQHVMAVGKHVLTVGAPGGPSQDLIQECVACMNGWVVLVISTVQAEFSACAVAHTMEVFNTAGAAAVPRAAKAHGNLEHIAQVFGLSFEHLRSEYDIVLPSALRHTRQNPATQNLEAWRSALAEHPAGFEDLRQALVRCGSLTGCTTSGVEHTHSLQDWLLAKRRCSMTSARENVDMKMVNDHCPAEKGLVVELARNIWSKSYGRPRATKTERSSAGSKQPHKSKRSLAILRLNENHLC